MELLIKCGDESALKKAFDTLKETRKTDNEHIDIVLESGQYYLNSPIDITPEMNNFSIKSANGKSVISGGRRIDGFYETTFNGVPCFAAKVDNADFTDLYINGKRADYTRYPDKGVFNPISVEDEQRDMLLAGSSYAYLKKEDVASVNDIEDAIISFCHFWVDEHTPVKSYDRNTGKLEFLYRSRFSIAKNTSGDWDEDFNYYIENTKIAFKNPNEWYLDRKSKTVYYIPESETLKPQDIVAVAPRISKVICFNGSAEHKCRNIEIENIIFEDTKGDYDSHYDINGNDVDTQYASDLQSVSFAHGSVELEHCENVKFTACEFRNLGVHAVNIQKGCSDVKIIGCRFFDMGAGAIKINGADSKGKACDLTHNITVEDCIINRCGRRYLSACGIIILNAFNNTVRRNQISDLFYTGISCGWVWGYDESVTKGNLIENNHIYNLGQGVLSDMGGIYTLGKQPGTVVRGNLIHDIKSCSYGGWAMYADEGSSDEIFENNICYNTSDNAFHQHYGKNNTVRNNIFAFTEKEPIRVTRNETHLSVTFENNIIFASKNAIFNVFEEQIKLGRIVSKNNTYYIDENTEPLISRFDGLKDIDSVADYGFDKGSVFEKANPDKIRRIISERKKDLGFI